MIVALATLAAGPALAGPDSLVTPTQAGDRLAWWREARFGMFIHWGPVSLKGTEISWSRANSNPAHPNKGPIPVAVYDNLYKEFNPTKFNAKTWAAIAQSAGMKYMVLTAKHCDGFCLWNSKASNYSMASTPFRRDICAELADAARRHGLRIGWYYSPMDWRDPNCRNKRNATYVASMHEHLRELLSNYGRIDLLWFDTDGCPAPWDQKRTYALVRSLQPGIVINNRLDLGSMNDYDAMPIAPEADYYTPEQRIGDYDRDRPWETCMTLGTQWSWKPEDQIKSAAECIRILARCAGGDGNLLLNVGPMPNGEIEPHQAEVLRGIGTWLQKYGSTIYGTRGGPFRPTEMIASTRKGSSIYLHLLSPNITSIRLPRLPANVVDCTNLQGEAPIGVGTEHGYDVFLPARKADTADTVLEIKLDRPADTLPAVDLPVSSVGIKSEAGAAVADSRRCEVAVYYFPNYHPGDPRNSRMKGEKWSEWELVKAAKPRFPGHDQPKVPLWGYQDESDPTVMTRMVRVAAEHVVNAFIFDWYYYDDGPFLNRCLNLGYLKAPDRQLVKFALMWANHDWLEIQPYKRGTPQKLLFPGKVTPETFDRLSDHVIKEYFSQPCYWMIGGKPYFSIYDLGKFVESFGSVNAARRALDRFREKTRRAGLAGIHLNAVAWGQPILPGETKPVDLPRLIKDLGFDSTTSYVWIHHVPLPRLRTDYSEVRDAYNAYWDQAATRYSVPYFPNVSMGWDSSPRANQADEFGNFGYPFTNTISGNTPERFRAALRIARDRLSKQEHGPRILTINSWNEWTEGSYIEPDTVHRLKYLEAIRDIFGRPNNP
jgi:hypothetical protein